MRILHLLDRPTTARPAVLAMLADNFGRLGEIEQHLACFGRPADLAYTATLGLTPMTWLRVWPALTALSAGALRRQACRHSIDLIHTWSPRALSLAAMACPDRPRVLSVTRPLGPRGVHWLRVLLDQAPGRCGLLATSNTRRRELLAGGVTEDAAVVVRPAVDMARIQARRREALRQAWGAEPATRVCLLLADPPQAAEVGTAGAIMAQASATGEQLMLISPRQCGRRCTPSRDTWRTDPAAARPWNVLPGCDAALALGEAGGGLALPWAMAANVPIVGEASYAVSEIVEDRHSALLARPGDAAALVAKLLQLRDERQLAWALRDMARHEAYSFFSRQRYCGDLARVYGQMIGGQRLDVPPPQVTGGMRFTGRA